MLNSIQLKYFKCFESLNLPLAPLTLLSGANASGKSTVLQALVLLHQTMQDHQSSKRLMLNGKSIQLGTVSDVVNEQQGGKSFEIGVSNSHQTIEWFFLGERAELSAAIDRILINKKEQIIKDYQTINLLPLNYSISESILDSSSFIDHLKNLTYITAERIGPRETYILEDKQMASVVGPKGEYTMSIFYSKRDDPILEELITQSESRNTLFHQVTARMQEFFPNCLLAVEKVQNVNAVTLRIKTSSTTEFHSPVNVGFGLTQVLPIIIAALSAKKEDILLIENPEVHLHPSGQALMGQFLAEVANTGVQIIIETHSDHVLNGIRRFVKAGKIQPEKIALHFFRPYSNNIAQVVSPQINNHGDLDSWPDGFFDQFDKDMNFFAGW